MDKKGIGKRRAERELQLMGMIRLRKKIGYTGEPWNIGECDFSNTLVVFIQYPPEKKNKHSQRRMECSISQYHTVTDEVLQYPTFDTLTKPHLSSSLL